MASFRDEVIRPLTKRVQRWHPLKLGIIWAAYVALSYTACDDYSVYGWFGPTIRDYTLLYCLWIGTTVAVVWITWQWAGARERHD